MDRRYIKSIADKLSIREWQVEHTIELLEEGATVPFISRYRKERTGRLDEVQVIEIKYEWNRFTELDKRKEYVLKSILEQERLTKELEKKINDCLYIYTLEDIYLPFKPKRRTKAAIAKEKGLEPLADLMLTLNIPNFKQRVESFVSNDVPTTEDVLSGAKDIIAEKISENMDIRKELRDFYNKKAILNSKLIKGKEEEGEKYQNYFSYSGDIAKMPSYRLLAILRGAEEGFLKISLTCDSDICKKIINRILYKGGRCSSFELFKQIDEAADDSYKRLLHPSI